MTFRCNNSNNGNDVDDNVCLDTFIFPKSISNLPNLSKINYRIGRYSDFRKALFKKLDKDDNFKRWTYRSSDDPGIAILEGVSIIGDILTFYQELYANEKFLRTAKWKESISSLIKLVGYRLSPGIASHATFAVQVKGGNNNKSVMVPKGTQFDLQLEKVPTPVIFETFENTKVYPQLGKFKLFVPQTLPPKKIQMTSNTEFYISEKYSLKKGDRLMIGFAANKAYNPKNPDRLVTTQIVTVDEIRTLHGRQQIFKIKGNLDNFESSVPFICYKLGRSFSHFGHNSPRTIVSIGTDENPIERYISYTRYVTDPTPYVDTLCDEISQNRVVRIIDPNPLNQNELPLNTIVNDISVADKLLIQGKFYKFNPIASESPHTPLPHQTPGQFEVFIRDIKNITTRSITWGSISGSTSIVEIDKLENANPVENRPSDTLVTDIRNLQIFEVTSPKLTMHVSKIDKNGQGNQLIFYNEYEQTFDTIDDAVEALKGRDIQISKKNQAKTEIDSIKIIDATTLESNSNSDSINLNAIILTLDKYVNYSNFPNNFDQNLSDVYGNLVYATQGKTQNETVLGNGDNGQKFQTFKIPQSPLTFLLRVDEIPSQVPELEIFVNGQLWKRVESFFDRGVDEQIYIIREDSNGDSWVQFGDGKTGLRLPSGIDNVTAIWRTGVGANGLLKEGTAVQLSGRIDRFDKALLHLGAVGGSQQETGDHAKNCATGKIQSLDRIVSLKDFEMETLSIPGIKKVLARWDLLDGATPGIILTVLLDDNQIQNFEQIRKTICNYDNNRGARNFPLSVIPGRFADVYIQIDYAMDSSFRQDVVEKAIRDALGVVENEEDTDIENQVTLNGLFGLNQRQFGQSEHITKIKGVVQNVVGVIWIEVMASVINSNNGSKAKTSQINIVGNQSNNIMPHKNLDISINKTIICTNDQILRLKMKNLWLTRISLSK